MRGAMAGHSMETHADKCHWPRASLQPVSRHRIHGTKILLRLLSLLIISLVQLHNTTVIDAASAAMPMPYYSGLPSTNAILKNGPAICLAFNASQQV